jgi:hypothetical protein
MTVIDVAAPKAVDAAATEISRPSKLGGWFRRHRVSMAVLIPVLVIAGLASAWNLQGWPGRVNDDEGTYVAEAWAMLVPHHLSHYTYWYDHPPLGWALVAGWAWLTHGFQRYPSAVMLGREVMWLANLASCALLYALARRLQMRRAAAAAAVVVFGLSPLAIFYHRMVFLDNLAVMWLLPALAIRHRRGVAWRLRSGAGSASRSRRSPRRPSCFCCQRSCGCSGSTPTGGHGHGSWPCSAVRAF